MMPANARIRVEVSTDGTVQARIGGGNGEKSPAFPIGRDAVDASLIRLFEQWLQLRSRQWQEVEIRTFGALLHRHLFGAHGWTWVESAIERTGADVVRLELTFPAEGEYARLAAMPWEFLYRPDSPTRPGNYLAADPGLVLCRFVPNAKGEPWVAPVANPHILVVVSQPNDRRLGTVQWQETYARIEETAAAIGFAVTPCHNPTAKELRAQILAAEPDVVHIMGHARFDTARGEGSLALSDPSRIGTSWVDDRQLADLMTDGERTPRVVVLHACEGGVVDFPLGFAGLAPQLVRQGVPTVVAMQYAVTNQTAMDFSACLYRELGAGRDVDVAVQTARREISRAGATSDPRLIGVPVVYLQSHWRLVDPDRAEPATGDEHARNLVHEGQMS